jgi:hypothetical protein
MVDAHSKAGGGAFPPKPRGLWKETPMDKSESTVRIMLTAIEAPLYDVGVLSERGMLPGLDGSWRDSINRLFGPVHTVTKESSAS